MKNKTRQSGIELLRIIAILGVIILHYNNPDMGGGLCLVTNGSINQYILLALETLFACSVNVFIMISAYFLSTTYKRSVVKILELVVQVSLFRIAAFLLGKLSSGSKITIVDVGISILPVNYFVILYGVLYFISPYINRSIEGMTKLQMKKMVYVVFVLFSIWPFGVDLLEKAIGYQLNGISTIGVGGSQAGYSIVNFVLIYIVAAYLRKYPITIENKKLILAGVGIFSLNYVATLIQNQLWNGNIIWWNYDNPFLIVFAALVVMLFLRVNIHNSMINEISKATFTCYLIHIMFLQYIKVDHFVNRIPLIMIVHIIVVAIGIYIVSYVVYKIYYVCSNWFFCLLDNKIKSYSSK